MSGPAFLFDLDGTLMDSVYHHVLAWQEALARNGIRLSVWRIHRRIGMSGGLLANAMLRETGHPVTADDTDRLRRFHAEAYAEPDPDLFLAAGEQLGVDIEHSIVVGDSVWDLFAARRAHRLHDRRDSDTPAPLAPLHPGRRGRPPPRMEAPATEKIPVG